MSAAQIDQATDLRLRMARMSLEAARPTVPTTSCDRAVERAHVIAIASGKGGVGKTNVAVNLAMRLARRGRRVVLVDADLGTANADVILNVDAPLNLGHVVRGERRIDEISVAIEPGIELIAGASGLAGVADLSAGERVNLVDALAWLESRAELILVDCGAGISQNVLAFAQAADDLLLVTTPEPTALADAYALAKVISRSVRPPRLKTVINQAYTSSEARRAADRVACVAARFLGIAIDCLGHIPHDDHVRRAVRQRAAFVARYPACPASISISTLAAMVDRQAAIAARPAGFFRRVVELFN